MAAARAEAKAAGKDLLLIFLGPDTSPSSRRFQRDVLSQAAFREVSRDFVAVTIASHLETDAEGQPSDTTFDTTYDATYGVLSLPSVLLTDADGRPYARTGYLAVDAALYLRHLAVLQRRKSERDTGLASIRAQQGRERASALAEHLQSIDPWLHWFYRGEIEETLSSCPAEASDLREELARTLERCVAERELAELRRRLTPLADAADWDGFEARVQDALAAHPDNGQIQRVGRYFLAIAAIDGRNDLGRGIEWLNQALDCKVLGGRTGEWQLQRALESVERRAQGTEAAASGEAPPRAK